MPRLFKEKAAQLQAVEVTDVLNQLAEVATMINATEAGMTIKDGKKVAVFKVEAADGKQANSYQVGEGQVISVSDGQVKVSDSTDFYSKYEPAGY